LVKADIGATSLRLGQTASVLIDAPALAGVIKLPLPALFQQGGHSMVWLVDRATMVVRAHRVEVAGADGNLVLIGGGLAPGQVVVTAGVHALTEGQKVRWYVEPGASAATAVTAVGASSTASAASR
jgi:multidrug efflux pump subunit AcrA (membrane-fusion protein)